VGYDDGDRAHTRAHAPAAASSVIFVQPERFRLVTELLLARPPANAIIPLFSICLLWERLIDLSAAFRPNACIELSKGARE